MITDDERREMAKKLRELDLVEFYGDEFYGSGEAEDVLGLTTVDGYWYKADGVSRLADLIEPEERTCYAITTVKPLNQVHELYVESCSSCGYCFGGKRRRRLPPYYDEMVPSRTVELPNYCPSCGAKVVE